jgi:hypothetical protein
MKLLVALNPQTQAYFPYRVDMERSHPEDMGPMLEEVWVWAEKIHLDCIIASKVAYFKTEADALFFMMRWA